MSRSSRLVQAALAAAAVSALLVGGFGCSSAPVARRTEPRFFLHGSETPTAMVFSDPALDPPAAALASQPEYARLDADLSPRVVSAQQARDEWPEPDRPSLRDYRRLYFNSRPGEYLYFDARREHSRREWRPWW